MRCSDEYDRPSARYFPRTSRVYLSEEDVYDQGEDPQKGIVDKVVHRRKLLFLVLVRCHLEYCGPQGTQLIDGGIVDMREVWWVGGIEVSAVPCDQGMCSSGKEER